MENLEWFIVDLISISWLLYVVSKACCASTSLHGLNSIAVYWTVNYPGWVQTLPLVPKSSFFHSIASLCCFILLKLFWKVTSAPSLQPPPHHLHKFSISLVHFLFLHIQSDICLNYCSVKLFHKRYVFFGNSGFFPNH